jgi:hypothetical protein
MAGMKALTSLHAGREKELRTENVGRVDRVAEESPI